MLLTVKVVKESSRMYRVTVEPDYILGQTFESAVEVAEALKKVMFQAVLENFTKYPRKES